MDGFARTVVQLSKIVKEMRAMPEIAEKKFGNLFVNLLIKLRILSKMERFPKIVHDDS